MPSLRILTAGESHGISLIGILEGMPSGVIIDKDKIDIQMRRRQSGYGRGGRMQIESDEVEILSGLRFGKTIGSPISVSIANKDWSNWKDRMDPFTGEESDPVLVPRPGHADYAGGIKYDHADLRNVLERASARETAMRVALGAIVRQFIEPFGIWIGSHVIQIYRAKHENTFLRSCNPMTDDSEKQIQEAFTRAESSKVRCSDANAEKSMISCIQDATENGDSVGGVFESVVLHTPIGLGSYAFWDKRLDASIASAFMSIPGIKSVEIGMGLESAKMLGSEVHDAFALDKHQKVRRTSDRAGGVEGGISNGQPILVFAGMKPIPTLKKPLPSVHLKDKKAIPAHQERSDVCAVPAASIVGEAMLAIIIGNAFYERYGGDTFESLKNHYERDIQR